MSWHFSQALVEAYSEANSSGGRPSALLSGKPIPQVYLSPDRMKAFSRISRFGMTCEPLTDDLGAAVLTWCLAASPARTSAQPAKAPESTESAAECGRTWRESFARWDRATSSWRTPQCSLLADLDVFSETWPQWGTMHAGECSEQSMPALRTSETGSGFWPTPLAGKTTASGELVTANGEPWKGTGKPHSARTGKPVTTALMDAVRIWPTPTVCGNYNRKGLSAQSGDGLATAVKQWPTPTCHMAKECDAPSEANRNEPSLTSRARGGDTTLPTRLNPVWVEWLMGFPLGWTDLKPLATDKFQSWRHSHGGF